MSAKLDSRVSNKSAKTKRGFYDMQISNKQQSNAEMVSACIKNMSELVKDLALFWDAVERGSDAETTVCLSLIKVFLKQHASLLKIQPKPLVLSLANDGRKLQ
ncbi:MAG: hypothetical protein CMF50_03535 [Legionellales bacterium]|nr:hypothetical protein [Legionellales bacterium]